MDVSVFLAKVIGLYFVIISLYVLFNQKKVRSVLSDIQKQPALKIVIGVITLLIGLLLVVSHNVWVMAWPAAVTIVSWFVLSIGILRLFFPCLMKKMAYWGVHVSSALIIGGLIHLFIGIYLIYVGFY